MIEYTLGKESCDISCLEENTSVESKLFANIRKEGFSGSRLIVNHSTFAHMGFKNSKFLDCSFFHCIFIDCYFKPTTIEHSKFIGCKFINCNFEKIKLSCCDFRFSEFSGCYIDFDVLCCNLPAEYNLRWKICKNLSLESLKLGDVEQYRKYYFEERKSGENHYAEIIKQNKDYYKDQYRFSDSVRYTGKLISSKLSNLIWGYGERIHNLIFIIVGMIILFSLLYLGLGDVFKENGNATIKALKFWESIYVSACNFFTITSDFTSSDVRIRILTALEGFIGIGSMGFFVAALFRYINRR